MLNWEKNVKWIIYSASWLNHHAFVMNTFHLINDSKSQSAAPMLIRNRSCSWNCLRTLTHQLIAQEWLPKSSFTPMANALACFSFASAWKTPLGNHCHCQKNSGKNAELRCEPMAYPDPHSYCSSYAHHREQFRSLHPIYTAKSSINSHLASALHRQHTAMPQQHPLVAVAGVFSSKIKPLIHW